MWISELSERTGIPVDTIKHYLRIGVLHRGEPVAHRRAEYQESHVARLKLVRAMTEVGDMKLDAVRRVFRQSTTRARRCGQRSVPPTTSCPAGSSTARCPVRRPCPSSTA